MYFYLMSNKDIYYLLLLEDYNLTLINPGGLSVSTEAYHPSTP